VQPSNAHRQLFAAISAGYNVLPDPGTGATINIQNMTGAIVRGWGAGTYKLPLVSADMIGTELIVIADAAQTWQQADATDVVTVGTGAVLRFVARSTTTASAWTLETVESGQVTYDDSNDYTTAATVNDALDELYTSYLTTGHIDIPLSAFRIVDADGDVGNLAAVGGVTASDSVPFLEAVGTTNAWRLGWATGQVVRIGASVACPADFDGALPATVEFIVSSAGTTNSFNTAVVITNWDGGSDVSDTLADTATTAVKVAPATVAASDIPAAPLVVTVSMTPPTHATDILYVYGCRIRYTRVVQSG